MAIISHGKSYFGYSLTDLCMPNHTLGIVRPRVGLPVSPVICDRQVDSSNTRKSVAVENNRNLMKTKAHIDYELISLSFYVSRLVFQRVIDIEIKKYLNTFPHLGVAHPFSQNIYEIVHFKPDLCQRSPHFCTLPPPPPLEKCPRLLASPPLHGSSSSITTNLGDFRHIRGNFLRYRGPTHGKLC